jgi:hypothetical protein
MAWYLVPGSLQVQQAATQMPRTRIVSQVGMYEANQYQLVLPVPKRHTALPSKALRPAGVISQTPLGESPLAGLLPQSFLVIV